MVHLPFSFLSVNLLFLIQSVKIRILASWHQTCSQQAQCRAQEGKKTEEPGQEMRILEAKEGIKGA